MSRLALRLAASAGLQVSLGVPSAFISQAVSAPNFAMVIHTSNFDEPSVTVNNGIFERHLFQRS